MPKKSKKTKNHAKSAAPPRDSNVERTLKVRTAILLIVQLVLMYLATKYNIPMPDQAEDLTSTSEETIRGIATGAATLLAYLGTLKSVKFEKLFFLGNLFPREGIEHEGAEKLLDLDRLIKQGEVIESILTQIADSSEAAEAFSIGASDIRDTPYENWASDVLESESRNPPKHAQDADGLGRYKDHKNG